MSTVTVDQFKRHCRITHAFDDVLAQEKIDEAEDECLSFLDRPDLPKRNERVVDEADSNYPSNVDPASDSDDIAPSVRAAILMIAQALYEGLDADEVSRVRKAAETKMFPYRNQLGV